MKKRIVWSVVALLGVLVFPLRAEIVPAQEPAKNVIWLIGDGMGPELAGFLMQGARAGVIPEYKKRTTALEELIKDGTQGLYFNHTRGTIVTDSAASATQMATGEWSLPLHIGINYKNKIVPTVLELAKQKGKAIGIITDTYVTDATPAGFTAHVLDRKEKYEIARQQMALAPEIILGGGKQYFFSKENANLLDVARQKGYQIAETKKELSKVRSGKVLGLFADKGMPMAVEMSKHPQVPELADMTQKALDILSQDPDGFVLMVEAGKIDWAAHAHDAGAMLAELKTLDKTLALLRAFADTHPDTLIYVNADHDTGLGAFSYFHLNKKDAAHKTEQGEVLYGNDTYYSSFATYKKLQKQRRSLYELEEELKKLPPEELTPQLVKKKLDKALGYSVDISSFENLQDVPGIFRQLNEHYGLVWATPTHSSSILLGVAYGPWQELFSGVYHNTDILPKLKTALGWGDKE